MTRALAVISGGALLALLHAANAGATTVWDESADGDLSTDPAAPTALTFSAGDNTVSGTVAAPDDTRDYLTFTILPGQALTAIVMTEWLDVATSGSGDRGFAHIDDGTSSVIPGPGTSGDFLGGTHLDFFIIGDNLLEIMAGAPAGGTGFSTPLGPGDYTFNVQQTGPPLTSYSFTFTVVPIPAAVWLFGGALLALAGLRRRVTR